MIKMRYRSAANRPVPLAALLFCLLQPLAPVWAGPASASSVGNRLEPGLQGQSSPDDNPGSILAQPYSKGVRVIGHDPISGRDSNVQLSWVDHCAYVSSTGGPLRLIGTIKGEPQLAGIAVIDVSNPRRPTTVKLLRDNGSIASLETMHAV